MNKEEVYNKLLKNALRELGEHYGDSGCNDLYPNEGILKGLEMKDIQCLEEDWRKNFPQDSKELEFKYIPDFVLVSLLEKKFC